MSEVEFAKRKILTDDEAMDLREIWVQDIRAYWPSVHAIAEARGVESRHVSEEVWRGTHEHAAFWGGKPARSK